MSTLTYLTIDDAPSETFLDKLNLLELHQLQAIWFCQGNFMQERPDAIIEAIHRGHIIGNHSYSHPSFEALTVEQGIEEIRSTDAIIDRLYRQANRPRNARYFRFPYGNKGNGEIARTSNSAEKLDKRRAFQDELRRLGYVYPLPSDPESDGEVDWLWTYSTNDWSPFNSKFMMPDFTTPEQVLSAFQAWNPPTKTGSEKDSAPEIILMHDMAGSTANQLFHDLIACLLEKHLPLARFSES